MFKDADDDMLDVRDRDDSFVPRDDSSASTGDGAACRFSAWMLLAGVLGA